MLGRFSLATLVAASLLATALRAEGPRLTPQPGLLLLRNGQILQGEITRAGDYYVVTLGPSGEIKLPAADVEAQTRDLTEAYTFKQAALPVVPTAGAGPHLDLAEWCLRHGMLAQSAEQLVAAMRREPDHPRIAAVERRLQLATERPDPTATPAKVAPHMASSDVVEKAVRDLPEGSLEKFAAVIQPLMLNRCGANQCHGPNAKSTLSLLKPAPGQNSNRRFTHRNLYATLQFVDRERPENSPLLTMPAKRHGNAATAVFDERTRRQFDEMLSWVKHVSGKVEPAVSSRPEQPTTLDAEIDVAAQHRASDAPAASEPVSASTSPTPPPAPVATGRFVPRDEFDPEIFNRRYLSGQ